MRKYLVLIGITIIPFFLKAQSKLFDNAKVTGSFQIDGQYYFPDEKIGVKEEDIKDKIKSQGYGTVQYEQGHFSAGLRFEYYLNPLLGYDAQYKGYGFPNAYLTYNSKLIEITLGSFYEQFGSGLTLRSYEERTLGIDNSISGARIKVTPLEGITLKGVIGKQRFYWNEFDNDPRGIVRGLDGDFAINDLIPSFKDSKARLTIGGSFVSKFQESTNKYVVKDTTLFQYNFPENVAIGSARAKFSYEGFSLQGEYAYKANDPSGDNNYIYKPGDALFLETSYSMKGFAVILSAKSIDNMSFRSDRAAVGNALNINYIPTSSKQHTYALPALYPYASQPNGEVAYQGDILYTIKKGSKLGGKYGTDIRLNYSQVYENKKTYPEGQTTAETGTDGYTSSLFAMGDLVYLKDFNVEVSHRFGKNWKTIFGYYNQVYNQAVVENHPEAPIIYTNIAVADVTYKINATNSIRGELQHLWTHQDDGNWVMGLLEYSIAPTWFITVSDMYNYDVTDAHYYSFGGAYAKGGTRIQLSYGRTRAGITCAGGVCRAVPASNGFTLSIISNF